MSDRFACDISWCLAVPYLFVVAQKSTAIYYEFGDETTFLNLALNIIRGHWLGSYDADTLVKAPAYSIFLALNHMTGFPINVGQGLLYFVAALYFSRVLSRNHSAFVGPILLAALLVIPVFFDQSMQRLLRDSFYCSVTLLYFAALFDAVLAPYDRWRLGKAALAGILGGILWVTREEGPWIVPATIVLLGMVAVSLRTLHDRSIFLRLLTRSGVGLIACAFIVGMVGLANLIFYGSFSVNEMKDADFQAAMTALQRASFAYHRPYLPVPKEARLRIYEQSPSFAKLKPFFDPEGANSPANWGCEFYKSTCGDIAGGWFMWAFREGAQRIGAHATPRRAKQFYHEVATEINTACSEKRLICAGWSLPLVPMMTAEEMTTVPNHLMLALTYIALIPPIWFEPMKSVFMSTDRKEQILMLLNHPVHTEDGNLTPILLRIWGWYRGQGDSWISVSGSSVKTLSRLPSPDLVSHFSDPALNRNRFMITGTCNENVSCAFVVTDSAGRKLELDPKMMIAPSALALGDGTLYVDVVERTNTKTARMVLYNGWISLISRLKGLLTIILVLGTAALLALVLWSAFRRQMSPAFIFAFVLFVAVMTRALLLALISAASFPVIAYTYCSPAIVLAVAAALVSIFELLRVMRQLLAPSA